MAEEIAWLASGKPSPRKREIGEAGASQANLLLLRWGEPSGAVRTEAGAFHFRMRFDERSSPPAGR